MAISLVMADSWFGCRRSQVCAMSFEARVAARGAIQTHLGASTRRSRREVCAKASQTRGAFAANATGWGRAVRSAPIIVRRTNRDALATPGGVGIALRATRAWRNGRRNGLEAI